VGFQLNNWGFYVGFTILLNYKTPFGALELVFNH
jgi:hypothetical protein